MDFDLPGDDHPDRRSVRDVAAGAPAAERTPAGRGRLRGAALAGAVGAGRRSRSSSW